MNRLLVLLLVVAAGFVPAVPADALQTARCSGLEVTIDMNTNGGVGLGTEGPDVILGTPGGDAINGLGGDDIICAGRGNDVVAGGRGDDVLFGAGENDVLFGGGGDDLIRGGSGDDVIVGGRGGDALQGEAGDDVCWGGVGLNSFVSCEVSDAPATPTPTPTATPAPTATPSPTPAPTATPGPVVQMPIYFNDFSDPADENRVNSFVHYRDEFVINHVEGVSDHAPGPGPSCTEPELTRNQTRDNPRGHVYLCHPFGDAEAGHLMGYAMDTSGYGFVGGLPDQVFEGLTAVSVDINTTSAGWRNFVEIKVIPAELTFVNGMPCGPNLPCNAGWDYDDIGAVGTSTSASDGSRLTINTPDMPDGWYFDRNSFTIAENGDIYHDICETDLCFAVLSHIGNVGVRDRTQHIFRDNQDGTLSFGIRENGVMRWTTAPGAFPDGPVRVVVAFHTYTGTKSGQGGGYDGNLSPSEGGFTWHWDNLAVMAETATPAADWFGGVSADRIVTPDGCIAFSQGQRGLPHRLDVAPEFRC